MKRPTCPRCNGLLLNSYEWGSHAAKVTHCLLCGWRTYPSAFLSGEDDFEEHLELIATICGWRY